MKTFLRVAAVVVALVVGAAVAVPVNAEQFTAQIQLAFQQLGIWPYNGSYGNGEVPTWSTAANAFVAASGGGGLQTDINIAEVGGNAVGATVPVSGTLTVNAGTGFSDDATQGGALSATGPQVMLQATGTYVASVSSGVPARMVGGLDQIIISRPHAHVGDFVKGLAAVTDGSSTSLVAAQGAGIRFCATTILISNSSSTNVTVDIRDGTAGSVIATFPASANMGGSAVQLQVPLCTTANTAMATDPSAAASTITTTAIGFRTAQ